MRGEKQRPIHLRQGKWTAPQHRGWMHWQWHLSQAQGQGAACLSQPPKSLYGKPTTKPLVEPQTTFKFAVLEQGEVRLTCSLAAEEVNPELLRGRRRLTACYQSTDWWELRKLLRSRRHSLDLIYLALVLLLPWDRQAVQSHCSTYDRKGGAPRLSAWWETVSHVIPKSLLLCSSVKKTDSCLSNWSEVMWLAP